MRECNKCKVDFGGDLEKCPLCQAELTGKAEPSVFPYNEAKKTGSKALAILAFATGASLLVSLFLWYTLSLPGDIMLSVGIALVVNYLFVRNIITHNPDFLRVVARYFLLLLAITAIWFLLTHNLFVTTFVIPGICMTALVFDAILLIYFRGTFVSGYAKYLIFNVVLGLAPLILVAFGLTTWPIPAFISALTSSILFWALLVFLRKQLITEIRKLFSM